MFQPGEYVKCTTDSPNGIFKKGATYRVAAVSDVREVIIIEKDGAREVNTWYAKFFEKVTSPSDAGLTSHTPLTFNSAEAPKASKNDKGKPDFSLIPKVAMEAEARAFMVGEAKYGRYNYYKGHKASQLIAALIRHAQSWNEGEENDPVDGQPHLGSVRACAAMILKQMALGTLIDDRYKGEK